MGIDKDSESAPDQQLRASHQLLMFMLAQRTQEWVPLETDRCPDCGLWLGGRWTRVTAQPIDGGYNHRYVVCVSCECGFQATTQHEMNRSG